VIEEAAPLVMGGGLDPSLVALITNLQWFCVGGLVVLLLIVLVYGASDGSD
jgi:hypothetical protein